MKLSSTAQVIYEASIIDAATGRVVKSHAPKRNLLLDSGLDGIALRSWWASFSRCVLGDGTTPTKRDSGAITVTIASEVATASAGYFEAADVGRLLKLDSGQEVYISGYTSSTSVAVSGASDDAASVATIWYVNETGHANELVRTATLSGDSGDNESTWNGSTLEHKRTFLFPVEVGSRTYREIGWSHTATVAGNLFGRDLIPGAGDSIAAGQQYKVIVRLQVALTPIVQTATPDVGTGGWNTTGDAIAYDIYGAFNDIYSGFGGLEPYRTKKLLALTSTFTLPAAPRSSDSPGSADAEKLMAKQAYVAGTRSIRHSVSLTTAEFNGSIYGLCIAPESNANAFGGRYKCLMIKFDAAQTKDSDHTLALDFDFTWGRTLTN